MDIQELQLKVQNLAQESGLFQVSTLSKLQELEKDIRDINNNLLAVVKNLDSLTANFISSQHKAVETIINLENKVGKLENSGIKTNKWFKLF